MRIGIGLGGSKIEGIVLEDDGQPSRKQRVATPANDYRATVSAICELVDELQTGSPRRLPVGIGTPGSLSLPAATMKNCNSVCLNGKPLKADLEARLGYDIRMENDANCFALSEALYGAGKGAKTVFGVIIGTGTGGGVVIDGSLLSGPNGIAGEWGHNPVPDTVRQLMGEDRRCYCGQHNCIETLLSGAGMTQTCLEHHGNSREAHEIAAAAQKGEQAAVACIELYSRQLARCLATVVNVIDPNMIVLGGGLSNIDMLYQLVPGELEKYAFTDRLNTRLSPPGFGDASGALGAACLWPA